MIGYTAARGTILVWALAKCASRLRQFVAPNLKTRLPGSGRTRSYRCLQPSFAVAHRSGEGGCGSLGVWMVTTTTGARFRDDR